jgi:hypothetical protein
MGWVSVATIALPIRKCNRSIRLNNNSTGYVQIMGRLSSLSRRTRCLIAALTLIMLGGVREAHIPAGLAKTGTFAGQYQIMEMAVSRSGFTVLSVPKTDTMNAPISSGNALDIGQNHREKAHSDLDVQTEAVQYQLAASRGEDRRLMLRIALGLGLAYVGFLACWIWATRRRSGPPRH